MNQLLILLTLIGGAFVGCGPIEPLEAELQSEQVENFYGVQKRFSLHADTDHKVLNRAKVQANGHVETGVYASALPSEWSWNHGGDGANCGAPQYQGLKPFIHGSGIQGPHFAAGCSDANLSRITLHGRITPLSRADLKIIKNSGYLGKISGRIRASIKPLHRNRSHYIYRYSTSSTYIGVLELKVMCASGTQIGSTIGTYDAGEVQKWSVKDFGFDATIPQNCENPYFKIRISGAEVQFGDVSFVVNRQPF